MGNSVIRGRKCHLEPRLLVPECHGTKRTANHSAVAWKCDFKKECVRLYPKKSLSFFRVMPSNTSTDTNKKTLLHVY